MRGEAYSVNYQTSCTELFTETVITAESNFAKNSILDVWHGFEYVCREKKYCIYLLDDDDDDDDDTLF